MISDSFQYVLNQYDEMAVELSEYSGFLNYHKARQLLRNRLPLTPIIQLVSTMKLIEQNLTEETHGVYCHLRNQVDGYFMQSHHRKYGESVTYDLRKRLYHSIIRGLHRSAKK